MSVLDRALLDGPTLEAARRLLGARLVRDDASGRRVARIVELEAYIGEDDRASHARFGRTRRNAVMFGQSGRAYVYLVYGMYDCLNIVTEPDGRPAALLVRAAEPLEGVDLMRTDRARHARARRRGTPQTDPAGRLAALPDERLASGPGVLAAAFGIDVGWTGTDLLDPASPLRLEPTPPHEPAPSIEATARIGIAYAGEPWASRAWRLLVAGHPSVSGPRRAR